MLIDPGFKEHDIISIKLGSGDEIIAKLVEVKTDVLLVTTPMLTILVDNGGRPGIQMMPFFMLSVDRNSKFPINRNLITCVLKTNKDATAEYIKATSGLVIPGSNASTKLVS